MAEIHVKRLPAGNVTLIEDPVLANNRLFITTQGHDTTTLAPLFQKNYMFNFNDLYELGYGDDNYGQLMLEKGAISCFGEPGNDTVFWDNQWMGYYHATLDWNFFPVKPTWRTINGRVLMINRTTLPTTTAITPSVQFLYPTSDITAGTGASVRSTTNTPSYYCFEDVSNQRMWGINAGSSTGSSPVVFTSYETQMTYAANPLPPDQASSIIFFIGVDDLGNLVWVSVRDSNGIGGSPYVVWRVNPTSYAVTTIIASSTRSGTRISARSWPSNIRRASATRRVFYSSHYDGTTTVGNLLPIRYVFNPADGSVTATNCTVAYPGGNTYATYSQMMSTEGAVANNVQTWHMKGWQFTVDGVNYITFWLTDKTAQGGTGLSRWNTPQKRTMMTYTIGAGTGDEALTFHSAYLFPTVNDIPKDFMPINAIGTQMMVPVTLQMRFFSFNTTTGWAPTGTYPYEFRGVGLDQTNRIWGVSRERGVATLHFITPTIPVTINVVMASTNFTFTGAPISTSCTVDAFGADGLRISTSVNLAIDGNTMVFTTNNTKNLTVTTSASASTVVNLTITGGGINNIIASVDI